MIKKMGIYYSYMYDVSREKCFIFHPYITKKLLLNLY